MGEKTKGKVEAREEKHAIQILREKGYTVTDLREIDLSSPLASISILNKVKQKDVLSMTQQLATMINSGLPLTEALNILKVQSKPALSKMLADIQHDVQGGMTLADALKPHQPTFSNVYIALVRAGEASGKLDEILERLAESEEKAREFRAKTKGALIYPVIVVLAMIGVITVMMVFVVPQLTDLYAEFDAELPFITQVLIAVSNFMSKLWYVLVLGLVGAYLWVRASLKTKKGREAFDHFKLTMPVFGPLRKEIIIAEVARTMSLLSSAGISILEALDIVSVSAGNVIFKEAIVKTAKGVEKGLPLAAMIAQQELFPPLFSQMVSVGEETGEMDTILAKVAHYFETEAEYKIKNLTTALEPIIIIVLGTVIGFIVLAIISPLYSLTELF